MEYDVVFPSVFVKSFTLVFKEGGSSFSTHCFEFCRGFPFVQGFVLLTHCHCLLVWRWTVLHQRYPKKMWSPRSVLFEYRLGFWDLSSPRLWIPICREKQRQCWLNHRCVPFWIWIATHSRMCSTALVDMLPLGRIAWLICCPSERLLAFLFPTICVRTQIMSSKLPRSLWNRWTYWVAQGRIFFIWTLRGRTFHLSIYYFWSGFSSIMRP